MNRFFQPSLSNTSQDMATYGTLQEDRQPQAKNLVDIIIEGGSYSHVDMLSSGSLVSSFTGSINSLEKEKLIQKISKKKKLSKKLKKNRDPGSVVIHGKKRE